MKPRFLDSIHSIGIAAITGRTLKAVGLSSFEYLKVYNDNTGYWYFTDPRMTTFNQDNRVPFTANPSPDLIKEKFWYSLSKEGRYRQIFHEWKNLYSIGTVVNLIKRHPGYYEMFSFGASEEPTEVLSRVLNSREKLEELSLTFKETAAPILKVGEHDRISISSDLLPSFRGLPNGAGGIKLGKTSSKEIAQLAVEEIERKLFSPFDLKRLAKSVGTSPSTLIRHFKNTNNETVSSYVRRRRLDEAKVLFQRGDYTVGEVAIRVGYENFGAFSEAFRSQFNMVPSYFKKNLKSARE